MDEDHNNAACARRHIRFGWWALLVFLSLGMGLEAMHGLKIGWYVDPPNETRRLLWTLAHAHGTLLALVNISFGLTIRTAPNHAPRGRAIADRCLIAAAILLPAGFFLGGAINYGSDPGLGILLVPVGAILLLVGVLVTARGVGREDDSDPDAATRSETARGQPKRSRGRSGR